MGERGDFGGTGGAGGYGPLIVGALLALLWPGTVSGAAPVGVSPEARAPRAAAPANVERVRYTATGGVARVVVMLSRAVPYEMRVLPGESARGSERRLVLDFSNARLGSGAAQPIGVEDGLLKQIRTGQFTARTARVVIDLASITSHSVRQLDNPARIVVDIVGRRGETKGEDVTSRGGAAPAGAPSEEPPGRASLPDSDPADRTVASTSHQEPVAREPVQEEEKASARPQGARPGEGVSEGGQLAPAAGEDRKTETHVGATAQAGSVAAVGERELAVASGVPPDGRPAGPATVPPAAPAAPSVGVSRPGPAPPARGTPWRVVLDPGHGGSDPGSQGVNGVLEKDVTLTIAKRLQRRLEDGLGAQVLLTRDGDLGRSLAERTAFANANAADIFVSIHTNADAAGELHGIETYTLNNSNERATIRLAKMENGPGIHTTRGDLSLILSDMVQNGKEEDSIALAERLHHGILARLRTHYPDVRNLGVKKGPFYVLVGAYMPCVLVETSFLSHAVEGRRLATAAYQDEIVEGLYLGIAGFLADARLARTL